MQDALGRKAIHAALRSLTNICSGLLNCGAESVPSGCNVRYSDQSRRLGDVRVDSGLPLIADVRREDRQVRKVPTTEMVDIHYFERVGVDSSAI